MSWLPNSNARRNRKARQKMTEAERLTGKTAEQLKDEQHALKAQALKRLVLTVPEDDHESA